VRSRLWGRLHDPIVGAMPTVPRQHEVEHEREGGRRVVAPIGVPDLRRLSPATILALQRTAGNQAVVRRVAVELRQAPPRPKLPPASDQASPENRHLAAEIDTVDALDDKALDKQRADNAKQVAESEGAAHAAAMQKHDAIEYVASRRGLAGPKLDIKQWRSVRDDEGKRRQFLNALVAERAAEEGSFKKAMRGIVIPDPLIVGDEARPASTRSGCCATPTRRSRSCWRPTGYRRTARGSPPNASSREAASRRRPRR
jgi:hypothetical protein